MVGPAPPVQSCREARYFAQLVLGFPHRAGFAGAAVQCSLHLDSKYDNVLACPSPSERPTGDGCKKADVVALCPDMTKRVQTPPRLTFQLGASGAVHARRVITPRARPESTTLHDPGSNTLARATWPHLPVGPQ